MPHTNAWSNTAPAGGDQRSAGDDEIRKICLNIDERMSLEHYWGDSTTYDGCAIPGKVSVVSNQDTAATIVANGGAYLAAYNGSIATSFDGNVIYVKKGPVNATGGTWTAMNSVADNTLTYTKLLKYDSGWFALAIATSYTKAHSLSARPLLVWAYMQDTNDNSPAWCLPLPSVGENRGSMTTIVKVDATNIIVRTGTTYLGAFTNSSGTYTTPTSGYCKIIALAP